MACSTLNKCPAPSRGIPCLGQLSLVVDRASVRAGFLLWAIPQGMALRESDLVVLFADGAGNRIALLIENKIDAMAQPEQGGRYRLRGRVGIDGIEDGSWKIFPTFTTATQAYLTGTTVGI